jgi:hypothetical protein
MLGQFNKKWLGMKNGTYEMDSADYLKPEASTIDTDLRYSNMIDETQMAYLKSQSRKENIDFTRKFIGEETIYQGYTEAEDDPKDPFQFHFTVTKERMEAFIFAKEEIAQAI